MERKFGDRGRGALHADSEDTQRLIASLDDPSPADFDTLASLPDASSVMEIQTFGTRASATGLPNLAKFPSLDTLDINFPQFDPKSLSGGSALRHLTIIGSNGFSDLRDFPELPALQGLELRKCSDLKTLAGIERFRGITEFRAPGCQNLRDISAIASLAGSPIQRVILTGSPVQDYSPLHALQGLQELLIIGEHPLSATLTEQLPALRAALPNCRIS